MSANNTRNERKKPKLVRDSFTMPKAEYAAIDTLKTRAIAQGRSIKKSELLRAGLFALQAMTEAQFKAAVAAVPQLKTGRPATQPEAQLAAPAPTPAKAPSAAKRAPARKRAAVAVPKAPAKAVRAVKAAKAPVAAKAAATQPVEAKQTVVPSIPVAKAPAAPTKRAARTRKTTA
ncbi:MAG: hypothetical protein R3E94_19090 [Burkholderiaceae bacterium]